MIEKICKENVRLMYPNETNERIINYLELVVEGLEEKYNKNVPNRLIIQLDLLRDLWKNYFKVSNELAKSDIYLKGEKGRIYQNPALQTQQQLYDKIMSSLKAMGLTIYEEKRDKIMEQRITNDNKEEESAQELLEKLIN